MRATPIVDANVLHAVGAELTPLLRPHVSKALSRTHGSSWFEAMQAKARKEHRTIPSSSHDPRFLLGCMLHEPEFAELSDEARRSAATLSAILRRNAHPPLQAGDDVNAERALRRLSAAVGAQGAAAPSTPEERLRAQAQAAAQRDLARREAQERSRRETRERALREQADRAVEQRAARRRAPSVSEDRARRERVQREIEERAARLASEDELRARRDRATREERAAPQPAEREAQERARRDRANREVEEWAARRAAQGVQRATDERAARDLTVAKPAAPSEPATQRAAKTPPTTPSARAAREKARSHFTRAGERARQLGDREGEIAARQELAEIYQGDLDEQSDEQAQAELVRVFELQRQLHEGETRQGLVDLEHGAPLGRSRRLTKTPALIIAAALVLAAGAGAYFVIHDPRESRARQALAAGMLAQTRDVGDIELSESESARMLEQIGEVEFDRSEGDALLRSDLACGTRRAWDLVDRRTFDVCVLVDPDSGRLQGSFERVKKKPLTGANCRGQTELRDVRCREL